MFTSNFNYICVCLCVYNMKPSSGLSSNRDSMYKNQQLLFHPTEFLQLATACLWRRLAKTNSSCCAVYKKHAEFPVCCTAAALHQSRHSPTDPSVSACTSTCLSLLHPLAALLRFSDPSHIGIADHAQAT